MSTALAVAEKQNLVTAMRTLQRPDEFIILDRYSETGIAPIDDQPRINAIATISGGFRSPDGKVQRTPDGRIYLHDNNGNAPGLRAILDANPFSLTVTFPSDNPRDFIQQRFTNYSATQLLAYGDENQITVIQGQNRFVYAANSEEYKAEIKKCKVSVSVYFTLAEWTQEGADMIFPDGFGLIRLRFTSSNSLRSILSSVRHVKQITGHIAGIPFELFMRQEEHIDSTSTKRKVYVWQAIPRPPQGIKLTAEKFRSIMSRSIEQRQLLALDAPANETMEMAMQELPEADLDETAIEELQSPAPCDAEYYNKFWHAIVAGSRLEDKEERHTFIAWFTHGDHDSLSNFLKVASEQEASELIEQAKAAIAEDLSDARANYLSLRVDLEALSVRLKPVEVNELSLVELYRRIANLESLKRKRQAELAAKVEVPASPQPDPDVEINHQPAITFHEAVAERLNDSNADEEATFDVTPMPDWAIGVMAAAHDKGIPHQGDPEFEPLIKAASKVLKRDLETIADITEGEAAKLVAAINSGKLKIEEKQGEENAN